MKNREIKSRCIEKWVNHSFGSQIHFGLMSQVFSFIQILHQMLQKTVEAYVVIVVFQLDILCRNYVVYKENLISFYAFVVNRTLTLFIFLNGKLLNLYQFVPKKFTSYFNISLWSNRVWCSPQELVQIS